MRKKEICAPLFRMQFDLNALAFLSYSTVMHNPKTIPMGVLPYGSILHGLWVHSNVSAIKHRLQYHEAP